MAESLEKLVENLQAELSNLRAQVSSGRPTAPKDLSLISLISKWSGTDRNGRRQMPDSAVRDPGYEPPNSLRSRRELATTPIAPPVTRSRARLQLQENPPV